MSVPAAARKMARASHSLVAVKLPSRTYTSSWTSAATSSGTKKIRRIVSALGRFIAHPKYNAARAPATTGPRAISNAYTWNFMRISRRHFVFGSLAAPVFAANKPAERPNVVIVLVDNLPAWVLGIYGNKEIHTPNIDRLAQTGTRFINHFACTAAAAEGRDTLLTGKTPMQSAGAAAIDKILGALGYAGGNLDQAVPGKPFCAIVHYTNLKPPYDG